MKKLDGRLVLITGGAGFLGSHLCERLLGEGAQVTCLDNLFTGSKKNIRHLLAHPMFDFVQHDVTNPIYLQADEVYNLACPASPRHYQFDPVHTTKTSVMGAINLLGLARRTNARVLHASTSEIYGDPVVHPQTEDYWGNVNPHGLRSCYDEGKRCAETLFFDYHRQHAVRIKVARIFNTYGPRMLPSDGRVVSNFIVQALRGEPITIYGNGDQTRSFCFVTDLIEGLVRLMNTPDDFTGPVNLGNPTEFTIKQLATRVVELTGSGSEVVNEPLPSDDPRQRQPDIGLAESQLSWRPKVELDEGLRATISYFRNLLDIPLDQSATSVFETRRANVEAVNPVPLAGKGAAVLVTGGAGYIGAHACKALALEGYVPVVFDNLSTGHRESVRWGPFVEGDLADTELLNQVMKEYSIDAVIHFAASAYVGESMREPGQYFKNNVSNTINLLDAMRTNGIKPIVFSSTCAVYGIPEQQPIDELSPQRPVNPYGESKLFVERALRWYGQAHGIRSYALRYFNAAGADPDGELGEDHDPETHLIPLVIESALGYRPEVKIFGTDYGTPDGSAVRDYIHVTDLAAAHLLALARLLDGGESHFLNLGTGTGHSVKEVIAAVERVSGRKANAVAGPRRPGDPPELVAAPGAAAELLGWAPRYSDLDTIVGTALNWHEERIVAAIETRKALA